MFKLIVMVSEHTLMSIRFYFYHQTVVYSDAREAKCIPLFCLLIGWIWFQAKIKIKKQKIKIPYV